MNTRRISSLLLTLIAAVLMVGERPSAYNPYGWKWATLPVPYYINPANGDNILDSAATLAIQAGADAWLQADTPFSFHFAGLTNGTTVTNNAKNEVFFRNATNGNAIATAYFWSSNGRALDADIVFWDGAYTFHTGTTGCTAGFYIEDIAAHEFGHALGLGHSSVWDATMYSGAAWCGTDPRSLAADDLQGIEAIYPGGAFNPPTVQIQTPTSGASFPVGTTVNLAGTASDPEDGNISSGIVWTSNLQGTLGNGAALAVALSEGTHTITASVTDAHGATAQTTATVIMTAAPTPPPPTSGVTLTGRGRKVKGAPKADLSWSGAASAMVDVKRNGTKRTTTSNSGAYTDNIEVKGGGSYSYTVCEAGTATCSNTVVITF